MGFFNARLPARSLVLGTSLLWTLSGSAGGENPLPVVADQRIPDGKAMAIGGSASNPSSSARPLPGSAFDGKGEGRGALLLSRPLPVGVLAPTPAAVPSATMTSTPPPIIAAVNPAAQPKSAFNLPEAMPQQAPEEADDKPPPPVSLEKSSRVERLSKILGGNVLTLPPPPDKKSAFSAKLIERLGVEDAARAAISQSYQLAAAESRQGYSNALTGVARGALLPQVKVSMRSGQEKTSPGADTYKYAKEDIRNSDDTQTLYKKGDKVPASSLMNGGIDSSLLSEESFAYNSIQVMRQERVFTVTQSLFDYTAWSEVARQNRAFESSRYAANGARLKAVLDASNSYLKLFQYSLALRFAQDYERALLSLYERIEARVSAGAGSQADLERVKGRRENAKSTVLDAKNALEVELTAFQKLTGFRPATLALPPDWILPVPGNIDAAVESASENNPALMADLKQAESMLAELRKVKGSFLPQIGLEYTNSLTRGTGGTKVPVVTSNGANFDADGYLESSKVGEINNYEKRIEGLMLTFNWNVFSGGQDFYQHRAVSEKYNEAMFRLLDTRRELEDKLRSSFISLATTASRVKVVAKEAESNQQVVDAFTEQMFAANRSLLDVLDAHQKLYQSRLDYTRLLIAEATLAYDVLYNIGTLTQVQQVPDDAESPRGRMGSLVGKDVWRTR